jgi:cell wall assembly regulator SMI1
MFVSIEDLWTRLERCLAARAPVDFRLNPPATEDALMAAEATLGVPIPRHLRLSFSTHDGQPSNAPAFTALGPLRSVAEMVEDWNAWNELVATERGLRGRSEGKVRAQFWNPKWLPLTNAGIGEDYFLDLDPDRGGEVGQIIHLRNEFAVRTVVAPSFLRWLTERVEQLETGVLAWSAKKRTFMPAAEAASADRVGELETALGAVFPYAIEPGASFELGFTFDHEAGPCLKVAIDAPARGLVGDVELLTVPRSRFGTLEEGVAAVREALDGAATRIRGGATALETLFTGEGGDPPG